MESNSYSTSFFLKVEKEDWSVQVIMWNIDGQRTTMWTNYEEDTMIFFLPRLCLILTLHRVVPLSSRLFPLIGTPASMVQRQILKIA